jgi:release factor glutamine methyltransferase
MFYLFSFSAVFSLYRFWFATWSPEVLTTLKKKCPEEFHDEILFLVEDTLALKRNELLTKTSSLSFTQRLKLAWRLSLLTRGTPLAYVVGHQPFGRYDFFVNRHVLIPRPETEELVEILHRFCEPQPPVRILDIGTGSGVLAISLKLLFPSADVSALDISRKAIAVAKRNAKAILPKTSSIRFERVDFLDRKAFEKCFKGEKWDLIVSNPPYIGFSDYQGLDFSVRGFEPKKALISGEQGLDFYRALSVNIEDMKSERAKMFLEMGLNQAESLKVIFKKATKVEVLKDITGRNRFFYGQW